jgi:hypothetical protein
MVLDRGEALEIVGRALIAQRSDGNKPWPRVEDFADDASDVLDALGFDALVASRERAIRYAVRFESELERAAELLDELKVEEIW